MTTYKYIISPTAQGNLNEITDYIAETLHNPKAAKDFLTEFKRIFDIVCTTPKSFTPCRKATLRKYDLRFVMVKNYKFYYSVNDADKHIEIAFVRYKSQNT